MSVSVEQYPPAAGVPGYASGSGVPPIYAAVVAHVGFDPLRGEPFVVAARTGSHAGSHAAPVLAAALEPVPAVTPRLAAAGVPVQVAPVTLTPAETPAEPSAASPAEAPAEAPVEAPGAPVEGEDQEPVEAISAISADASVPELDPEDSPFAVSAAQAGGPEPVEAGAQTEVLAGVVSDAFAYDPEEVEVPGPAEGAEQPVADGSREAGAAVGGEEVEPVWEHTEYGTSQAEADAYQALVKDLADFADAAAQYPPAGEDDAGR